MWELPVGFVGTEGDLVEKIADRQVQEAVASMFRKFREFGSARQTMLWYHDQHIPLPHVWPGTGSTDIIWQLPTGHRLHQIVKNRIYAGALAYGRTAAKTVVEDQRARTASTGRRKPPEEWSNRVTGGRCSRANHVNTATCVSTSTIRRVRDNVEWSGAASVTSRSRNDGRLSESATRHAIPRSEDNPSNSR